MHSLNNYLLLITILGIALFISCSTEPDNVAISEDGVEIKFDVQGEGEPALVFVHGWCCDRSYWDAQVPHFAQKYKVVTIDLAGHGESSLGRESYTMEAFGEDIVAVIEKLGIDNIVLIGHSMGGPVILETARQIPERIIGLVGADTFGGIGEPWTQDRIDIFLEPFRSNFEDAASNLIRRNFFTLKSDSVLIDKIVTDMAAGPPEVGIKCVEGNIKYDRATAFKEVKVPIRTINSGRNQKTVEEIRKYAPTFEVIAMSNVGHFVMMEDPETFNRLLEETIQELIQ